MLVFFLATGWDASTWTKRGVWMFGAQTVFGTQVVPEQHGKGTPSPQTFPVLTHVGRKTVGRLG